MQSCDWLTPTTETMLHLVCDLDWWFRYTYPTNIAGFLMNVILIIEYKCQTVATLTIRIKVVSYTVMRG